MFNEVMNSVLLFNEAEAISPLHVFKSSGLPLSSKGITKLIIEEKKMVHRGGSCQCLSQVFPVGAAQETHTQCLMYILDVAPVYSVSV